MEYRFLYITVANKEEAMELARRLVTEKKVACANVLTGASSVYWWEGKIEESEEVVLIAKTTAKLVNDAISRVKQLHSYSCPCVVALPIIEGNAEFLEWIGASVAT